jgi:hypothetical protein
MFQSNLVEKVRTAHHTYTNKDPIIYAAIIPN